MTPADSPHPNWEFPPRPVLVIVDAFVEPEHEEDFNRWYDERHMPAIVGCPGIQVAARYRSSDEKERKYSTHYIIDDESAMETDEIAAIRGFDHLTPHVRYERRIYRPVSSYSKESGQLVRY